MDQLKSMCSQQSFMAGICK